jgi:hypothetical protein
VEGAGGMNAYAPGVPAVYAAASFPASAPCAAIASVWNVCAGKKGVVVAGSMSASVNRVEGVPSATSYRVSVCVSDVARAITFSLSVCATNSGVASAGNTTVCVTATDARVAARSLAYVWILGACIAGNSKRNASVGISCAVHVGWRTAFVTNRG